MAGLAPSTFFNEEDKMFGEKKIALALLVSAVGAYTEEVKWPVPPAGFNQASSSIPKGTVSNKINYTTRNLGERACKVYTPPGYSATRAEKYPVLYLHHGIGGNENAWTASTTDGQEGNADKVMDFLYSKADLKVVPMIVVMPMGNMTGASGDAWQAYEDVLINDLAPYIQKTYNASPDASMRAMAGLSMGGGQTLNIGYKNPTFFNWLGAFSPAPNTTAAGTTMNNATKIAAVKTNVKLAFLAAGTAESGYLNTARSYHNFLNQNGISPLYLQVEEGLNHEPKNWNRQLYNFAQRIFKGSTTEVIQLQKAKVNGRTTVRVSAPEQSLQVLFGKDLNKTSTINGRSLQLKSEAEISIPTESK
jgi:enterochelin esterase-like enzyme